MGSDWILVCGDRDPGRYQEKRRRLMEGIWVGVAVVFVVVVTFTLLWDQGDDE